MGVTDYSSYEKSYGMPYLKMMALVQQVNGLLQGGATIDGETAGSSVADVTSASSAHKDASIARASTAAADSASADGEVRKAGSAGSAADASAKSE